MVDPYKMVVINVVTTAIAVAILLLYKLLFPKRKFPFLAALILISILPTISMFRKGVYESGDFTIHIYRTMAFFQSLLDGQLMPSWAANLNATYGYPLFIFNYPLPYYILSLIHFFGFSFVLSMKLFLFGTTVLSGLCMYLFCKKELNSKLASFGASLLYIFAPYHLIDVHFKVVVGEILSFIFLPLVFHFAREYFREKNVRNILLAGFFFGLLILSHAVIGLFAATVLLLYMLSAIPKGSKQKVFPVFFILLTGFLLSFYNLAAPFIYNSYLFIQNSDLKTVYFPTIPDLLYAPWRYGLLFQGNRGEISFLIGYVQLFTIVFLSILLMRKKVKNTMKVSIRFWLVTTALLIFLITPYSKFLWEYSSFMKAVGSHRLLVLVSFTTSILGGYLMQIFEKKRLFVYMFLAFAVGSTILNWGHRRLIPTITEDVLKQNLWKSTSEGEGHFYANTKWADPKHPWFLNRPKQGLEIKKGEGEIRALKRTTTEHNYIVYAKSAIALQENTLYFPGWNIYDSKKKIESDISKNGILIFKLSPGFHLIQVVYEDIFLYKIAKLISVAIFLSVIISIFLPGLLRRFSRYNKKICSMSIFFHIL